MAAVTNNELRIANTDLQENQQNIGSTDINETKPGAADVPHVNKGRLANAIEKTSDKTKFEGGNVVRKGDLVATEEAHPGVAGGVKTHTYLKESWATEGAPNVLTENKPPTRDTDPTQQNKGNSSGQVVDPATVAETKKKEEDKLKKCSLKEFEKAECSHGRKLTTDRILEIVASEGEFVDFLAKRTNAVEPGDAECEVDPDHTAWVVSRKKGGGLDAKKEEFKGDPRKLELDWFAKPAEEEKEGGLALAEGMTEEEAKKARAAAIYDRSKAARAANPTGAGSVKAAQVDFDAKNPNFMEDQKNLRAISDAKAKLEKIGEIADFLKRWFARKDPVSVDVQAQACTGGQSCKIIAFPEGRIKWTLGEAEKSLVKRATDAVNKFSDFLSKCLSPLGGIEIKIKVLEGANVTADCEWKELTKDAPNPGLKSYQCNPDLNVTFNIAKLFEFMAKGSVPLARILDIFLPGSGWVVQKVINWFGLTAQVYISVELGIGIKFGLGLDEYWVGKAPTVKLELHIKFSIGLEIKYKDNLHIDGRAVAIVKPVFDNPKFERDSLIAFDLAEGKIQLGFEGMIHASIMWVINYDNSISSYPWEFPYGRQTLRPLKPLMALVKN